MQAVFLFLNRFLAKRNHTISTTTVVVAYRPLNHCLLLRIFCSIFKAKTIPISTQLRKQHRSEKRIEKNKRQKCVNVKTVAFISFSLSFSTSSLHTLPKTYKSFQHRQKIYMNQQEAAGEKKVHPKKSSSSHIPYITPYKLLQSSLILSPQNIPKPAAALYR